MPRVTVRAMPRGFTLAEALVVIGVIIVLVGIAVPSFSKFQAEALSTGCLNHLRQLFGGIEGYRQANQLLLPNTEPLPAVTGKGPEGGLPEAIRGWIDRDCTCWLCPADFDSESTVTGTSYLYLPGLYILTPGVQLQLPPNAFELKPAVRRELEARVVTGLYEGAQGVNLPVLLDSQDRHPVGDRVPRNALYLDGVVRAADRPPSEQAAD